MFNSPVHDLPAQATEEPATPGPFNIVVVQSTAAHRAMVWKWFGFDNLQSISDEDQVTAFVAVRDSWIIHPNQSAAVWTLLKARRRFIIRDVRGRCGDDDEIADVPGRVARQFEYTRDAIMGTSHSADDCF